MPWGHPDAIEALYCIAGCGTYGREFVQRKFIGTAPRQRVRICPPCAHAGWRLVGDDVEEGAFFPRELRSIRRPVEGEAVA